MATYTLTVLWLIRHAVTDENLQYHMIGTTDVSLGEAGIRQAVALSQYLKAVHFEAIYASPLARAKETAKLIAAQNLHHPSLFLREGLRELDLGAFEGKSSFQAYEQSRTVMDEALAADTMDFAFPGGELRSQAAKRFHRAVCEIVLTHPNGDVCVITHGAVMGCWLSLLHHVPLGSFRAYQPKHASITTVIAEWPQFRFHLDTLSETTHLEP